MAFPIYLIGIFSLRGASVALWMFFAVQWLAVCSFAQPPRLINPFGWAHGDLSIAGALLVSLSTWILSRVKDGKRLASLHDFFK
jgi:hypothetical protein